MAEAVEQVKAVCGIADDGVARNLLEAAGGSVEQAVALFFESGGASADFADAAGSAQ